MQAERGKESGNVPNQQAAGGGGVEGGNSVVCGEHARGYEI